MFIQKSRRRVVAEEEVNIAPEATEMLFEVEDVAELVAEISGKEVEVTSDEGVVTFAVGEDEFTVEAEGDEEVLEAVRRPLRNKRPVRASRPAQNARPVRASRRPSRVPRKGR